MALNAVFTSCIIIRIHLSMSCALTLPLVYSCSPTALQFGFKALRRAGGMAAIQTRTFCLTQYLFRRMSALRHEGASQTDSDGTSLCVFYGRHAEATPALQGKRATRDVVGLVGFIVSVVVNIKYVLYWHWHASGPVITFNVRWADGEMVGFAEVERLAVEHRIQLRTGTARMAQTFDCIHRRPPITVCTLIHVTFISSIMINSLKSGGCHIGCFCCIGGCQEALGLSAADIAHNMSRGRSCQDSGGDIIDGRPTGAVRVSVGYMTTRSDCDALLSMLQENFLNRTSSTLDNISAVHGPSPSLRGSAEAPGMVGNEPTDGDNGQAVELRSIYVYPIKSCAGNRPQYRQCVT